MVCVQFRRALCTLFLTNGMVVYEFHEPRVIYREKNSTNCMWLRANWCDFEHVRRIVRGDILKNVVRIKRAVCSRKTNFLPGLRCHQRRAITKIRSERILSPKSRHANNRDYLSARWLNLGNQISNTSALETK